MSRRFEEPDIDESEPLFCPVCDDQIDYDEKVYEDDGLYMCRECFKRFCIDNMDLDDMAKLLGCGIGNGRDLLNG